jgi:hypothetical protein
MRRALAALALFAGGLVACNSLRANEFNHPAYQYDLFYNYYQAPSMAQGGVPAQLYLSPRPVPAYVGHTYITYQPLMPHEFLYRHHKTYTRVGPTGGPVNRTRVIWW